MLPAQIDDLAYLIPFILFGGSGMAVMAVILMGYYNRANLKRDMTTMQRHEDQLMTQLGLIEAFFHLNQQWFIIWNTQSQHISMHGAPPKFLIEKAKSIPQDYHHFVDFDSWLPAKAAQELAHAVQLLEYESQNFDLWLQDEDKNLFQARGWSVGSYLMMSVADHATQIDAYLQTKHHNDDNRARLATMQKLLDEVKHPIWMRDDSAAIIWGNRAYFRVSGSDYELFSAAQIEKINAALAQSEAYFDKVPTIIDGDRHILDVSVVQGPVGSVGIAIDNTQMLTLTQETSRTIAGYLAIFDELSTSVAIFDAHQKLDFFNQSFAKLWPLDAAFLESRPSHALLLDRLREKQILPENPDWRQWKEQLFDIHHGGEPQHHIWNLLDGRTLRVIANPGPQGGSTWLYEDLSEKLQLEARYNTLIHMQGETLDHLYEGVALFGPDGRLRLANPAFTRIWNLPADMTTEGVHISRIEDFCAKFCIGEDWQMISAQITGFNDARDMGGDKIEHLDDRVIDYKLVPLPQGQTMVSFVDVSDRAKAARALAERNEALESVNRLRTDFVSHVSYELRTPLTSIIGFTDLLRTGNVGELNDRQHEYLNDISTQSIELLNLVNDILDLATLDAGIMQLNWTQVDVREAVRSAVARIEERMLVKQVTLKQQIDENLTSLYADAARLHQILFNLLANAVNFSPDRAKIDFSAQIEKENVVFCVSDQGSGIPADVIDQVFDRFYASSHHGGRKGAGLGLSIVKSFVELHHGSVDIDTSPSKGTTISCRFPLESKQQLHSTYLEQSAIQ